MIQTVECCFLGLVMFVTAVPCLYTGIRYYEIPESEGRYSAFTGVTSLMSILASLALMSYAGAQEHVSISFRFLACLSFFASLFVIFFFRLLLLEAFEKRQAFERRRAEDKKKCEQHAECTMPRKER